MTPRAVLFDLDDTLIPEWPAIRAGYAAVAQRVWGAACEQRIAALRDAAHAVWRAGRPDAYCRRIHFSLGEGLWGEFVGAGAEADALRAFVPELHARAFDAALPAEWRGRSPELVALWKATRIDALAPYPETRAVLDHLAARLPLALVTNGASRLQRRKLAATGLGDRFAAVVVSEEVGAGKPDPAPFEAALHALAVDRSEAVMVGNDADRDVAGARAAGIRPVWVRRDAEQPRGPDEIADLRELEPLVSPGSRDLGHRHPL